MREGKRKRRVAHSLWRRWWRPAVLKAFQQRPHAPIPSVHHRSPGVLAVSLPSRAGCVQLLKTVLFLLGNAHGLMRCEATRPRAISKAKMFAFLPTWGLHGPMRCEATHDAESPSEAVRVPFIFRGSRKIIKLFVSGRRSWRHSFELKN